MMNLLAVTFEAHHAGRNHHRRYSIIIGRDLLDDWTVSIRYGRTGRYGREQRFGNADMHELQRIVRERLRRRLTAKRRIDCQYRLTELHSADAIDAGEWLPSPLLSAFGVKNGTIAESAILAVA